MQQFNKKGENHLFFIEFRKRFRINAKHIKFHIFLFISGLGTGNRFSNSSNINDKYHK